MSPELGIAIVLALLWGPTALWLIYRALRGRQATNPIELFPSASRQEANSQLVPDALGLLGEPAGPWVCRTCRSLNRREANRCYSCRMANNSAGRHAADDRPASPGVPVMAGSIARSSGDRPASPGVPVMAESIARSSGKLVGATVALTPPRKAPARPEVGLAPEHAVLAGPPEATRVSECPFLGLREDPSTRYDYPDFANCCHSASERGSRSTAFTPRILAGIGSTKQPQRIGAEHQRSCCLTASHQQCARYLAVRPVTADR